MSVLPLDELKLKCKQRWRSTLTWIGRFHTVISSPAVAPRKTGSAPLTQEAGQFSLQPTVRWEPWGQPATLPTSGEGQGFGKCHYTVTGGTSMGIN